MRPHTRILYSLCDRITGEARGARQKDTGSNQARALHPTAQACAVGTPALPGRGPQRASLARWVEDIKGRAGQSHCLVRPGAMNGVATTAPHLKMRPTTTTFST